MTCTAQAGTFDVGRLSLCGDAPTTRSTVLAKVLALSTIQTGKLSSIWLVPLNTRNFESAYLLLCTKR